MLKHNEQGEDSKLIKYHCFTTKKYFEFDLYAISLRYASEEARKKCKALNVKFIGCTTYEKYEQKIKKYYRGIGNGR